MIELKKQGVHEDVVKAIMDYQPGTTSNNKSGGGTSATSAATSSAKTPAAKSSGKGRSLASSVDLMNHVYNLNKSTNGVTALEKSVAGIRTKQGPFGGSVMLHVDGAKSGVRVAADDNMTFVINTGGSTLPELVLYKLKSGKDKREVASMKINSFTGVKTGEDIVSLNVTKLEDGIFQVTAVKPLVKGEYFFTGKPVAGATSQDAYSFGIE
ncbi:MAG: hypothetical protein EOO02_06885 [Chitinophagaceae bacterium]|nr:MAG: hypothetical protein EOO02_06885 [Chitinophagaceae bacterium]